MKPISYKQVTRDIENPVMVNTEYFYEEKSALIKPNFKNHL